LVIIGTTNLGTEISDYLDITLHLGYTVGSLLLLSCLALILTLWFWKYDNLKVYPIPYKQKELFYWTTIFYSNGLGSAFGNFLGDYCGFSHPVLACFYLHLAIWSNLWRIINQAIGQRRLRLGNVKLLFCFNWCDGRFILCSAQTGKIDNNLTEVLHHK
jgi:uncharacterized membrane-anchored protein